LWTEILVQNSRDLRGGRNVGSSENCE